MDSLEELYGVKVQVTMDLLILDMRIIFCKHVQHHCHSLVTILSLSVVVLFKWFIGVPHEQRLKLSLSLKLVGITIRLPLKITSRMQHSSFWRLCSFRHNLSNFRLVRRLSLSRSTADSFSTSWIVNALGTVCKATNLTKSSVIWLLVYRIYIHSRDSTSATFLCRGMYFTVNWKGWSLNYHRCIRAHSLDFLL